MTKLTEAAKKHRINTGYPLDSYAVEDFKSGWLAALEEVAKLIDVSTVGDTGSMPWLNGRQSLRAEMAKVLEDLK